jgi:hypothetical protein
VSTRSSCSGKRGRRLAYRCIKLRRNDENVSSANTLTGCDMVGREQLCRCGYDRIVGFGCLHCSDRGIDNLDRHSLDLLLGITNLVVNAE